jgi:ParB-like chromosome segregation protein Spo0J
MNRVPKGTPAGRQEQESVAKRSLGLIDGGRTIMDWDTRTEVDYELLTDDERVTVDRIAKERGYPNPRLSALLRKAERVGDEIVDIVEALGEAAGHLADVQRGDVPAPEVEGNFVGWSDLLPKFFRQKRP